MTVHGVPQRVAEAIRHAGRPVCAYVYDPDVARSRAAAVRAALPAGSRLCYAVKANGDPRVLAAVAEVVDGFEVASGEELRRAREAGGRLLLFGGPGKTDAELAAAVDAGAVVNAESQLELRRLVAAARGRPVRVAIRVNRAIGAPAGSHTMVGGATPFGFDEAQLPAAVALARRLGLDPIGFALHAVSNNLDAAAHAEFVADGLHWSIAAATRLGLTLDYVNAGGGFGVDYTGRRIFDLRALGGVPADPRLVFEPGRYLAAAAGWYAAEVLDVKCTHGRWFAVVRGGTHHFRLPAAWGYSHPFAVLPMRGWSHGYDRPEVRDVAIDAVGELCTPRDVLARGRPVGRLRVGDVLVFANAGAYGWEVSHRDFLYHPYPEMIYL